MLTFKGKAFQTIAVLMLSIGIVTACSKNQANTVPSDFSLMMDVRMADHSIARNINIRIDAAGQGNYEVYNTGGTIQYDQRGIVRYDPRQVVKKGKFNLSKVELERIWDAINENKFFKLSDDYRMEIGYSYAFIMVQAGEKQHKVDNIGVEVPEVRAIVETVRDVVPQDLDFDYVKDFVIQK